MAKLIFIVIVHMHLPISVFPVHPNRFVLSKCGLIIFFLLTIYELVLPDDNTDIDLEITICVISIYVHTYMDNISRQQQQQFQYSILEYK